MSIPGSASPLFIGAAAGAAAAHQIDRSLRFDSGSSSYLSRTPSSAGNRKTWTWSGWVKRSKISESPEAIIFGAGTSGYDNLGSLSIEADDQLRAMSYSGGYVWQKISTAVFRDPSAWYHIVYSVDTTNSTAEDRVRLYVNGVRLTEFTTNTNPSQNADAAHINSTSTHYINKYIQLNTYGSPYLAEVHFIDGQALNPTDFGETNSDGVWVPIEFAGSYTSTSTSTTLSQTGWTVSSPTSENNIWDGNTSTTSNGHNGGIIGTVSFSPPLTNVTKVEVYQQNYHHYLNGSQVTTAQSGTEWHTLYDNSSSPITLNSVGNSYTNNTQTVDIMAIRINGSVVNSKTWTPPSGVGVQAEGLNSFYLKFADNSSNAALGTDSSGNSNTWTVNNLSVASGSGNDSLIDTPTNYAAASNNNGGNYATLNPLQAGSQCTLSNGNLDLVWSGSSGHAAGSTIAVSSGKWYMEFTVGSKRGLIGIIPSTYTSQLNNWPGNSAYGSDSYGYYGIGGNLYNNSTNSAYGAGWTTNDVIGVALDLDAGNLVFYKNGSSQGTAATGLSGSYIFAIGFSDYSSGGDPGSVNFGQRPFAYTPPTGHVSLCTQNLPDSTIADGSTAFDVALWTGNGSTQTISGLSLSPDFIWHKIRSISGGSQLYDIVRGTSKRLRSDNSDTESTLNGVTSFNSDGWTMSAGNNNNESYVSWVWDAGTSTASNTDGSITTNVRANASAGFSIISYQGNGTTGATIGHGLNSAPEWLVFKNRDDGLNWYVYHKAAGHTNYLTLDRDHGAIANNFLNNTAPTNSVITLSNTAEVNANNQDIICYAWTSVTGYSSFGSYTGNGSADGPFVYTGFRPKFILRKQTNTTNHWHIVDTERDPENVTDSWLFPNLADAEGSGDSDRNTDILSNGFKIRSAYSYHNTNGGTYLYLAFASHPFKTARAR